MREKPSVLILDDDKEYLESLTGALQRDFSISVASSRQEIKKKDFSHYDVVLLDIRLDDKDTQNKGGIDLLREMKKDYASLPIVMMTAYGDIDIAIEAMKLGASDFIQKTKVDIREIKKVLRSVLEKTNLIKRVGMLQRELDKVEPHEIVGKNPKIEEVRRLIKMVAEDGYVTVLIRGDTGTGKEVVARAIHHQGIRKEAPFMPVALSALNKETIVSDLFGHEKGAFTGAHERRIGFIEEADGGILFLDEIGDLDQEIQLKLLRFLEEKTFRRIGSNKPLKVDVQLLAATNRDLETAVVEGTFRKDLYFRLKVVEIVMPLLKDRIGDIPLLANYFIDIQRKQGRGNILRFSKEALRTFKKYDWSGNVRELKQAVEHGVLFASQRSHKEVLPEDLPSEIQQGGRSVEIAFSPQVPDDGINIREELARLELSYIDEALRKCGGGKEKTSELLGYNDRFVLPRRVKILKNRFPSLWNNFPYLMKEYR